MIREFQALSRPVLIRIVSAGFVLWGQAKVFSSASTCFDCLFFHQFEMLEVVHHREQSLIIAKFLKTKVVQASHISREFAKARVVQQDEFSQEFEFFFIHMSDSAVGFHTPLIQLEPGDYVYPVVRAR